MTESNPDTAQNKGIETTRDALLTAYREVCHSYNAVDDFRAKLLALLPIASGTAGILLLGKKDIVASHIGPIGLFGLAVTLGLFFYELRGIQRCGSLIKMGEKLEQDLHLTNAQFVGRPEKKVFGFIGATAAGWTVYVSVLIGWSYVTYVGFK